MKKYFGKVVLVLIGVLIVYVTSYFLIKTTKPASLVHNDTVSKTYRNFYMPIRKFDAKKYDHLEHIDHTTKVVLDGDYLGYKMFFNYNGDTFALYTSFESEELKNLALSLKPGDNIYLYIDYTLSTDDSFNNFLSPYISKIKKADK